MRVSTSAFYAWNQQPEITDKARKREVFDIKVRDIFEANRKTYGSRRLSKELKKTGINAGRAIYDPMCLSVCLKPCSTSLNNLSCGCCTPSARLKSCSLLQNNLIILEKSVEHGFCVKSGRGRKEFYIKGWSMKVRSNCIFLYFKYFDPLP
jgi:hypothetical protein